MRRYGWMSKAGLAPLLAIGLAAPAPGSVGSVSAAGAAANAIVDGKPVVFAEAAPVIKVGRMLVPARALLEAMGARMTWDPDARVVTATMQEAKGGGTVLKLKIGSPYVQRTMTDASGKTSDYVVKLDVAAQLLSDSTMIPLRASAELTGHALEWRQASRTAVISQPDAGAEPEMTFKQYALAGELFQLSNEEIEVFFRTNELRARHGKTKPFALSVPLSLVARLKSADMGEQGYFDHESPTYGDPFEMMRGKGIAYRAAAENIAAGHETPEAVVAGWEQSPGHLANMLGDYAQIGIGYAYYTDSDYRSYWTQQFISP
ncbi:Copper amine oxidase N-terminal domain-containing protein [Cohnella sp. OV330]|uniref:stalk domain-containing protein n=1 Tax=Cohnella sp. OV330 TaxID=1855288 RepID=UPI0008F05643|nr:stalk domain-containing protein [Cohnella sp. OV330]SFB59132.1 Copper amine oxidase N-terminal domain-containing protein [Cohnella sp. OV330]